MDRFIILFISVIIFPLSIYAQKQDALKTTEKSAESIDVDSLQQEISRLNCLIEKYKQSENSLNGKLYDCVQTINEQKKEIEKLNNKLLFADTIIARLSNDCLRKKYDAVKVRQAILNFEQMHSPELKSKFGRLKFLLNEYSKYNQELVNIFIEAQNDKTLGNPFTGQKRALTYIDKIKNTNYYRDVYSNNWTIPYLNRIIDKCFEIIKSFNPIDDKELHLLDLMK